MQIRIQIQNTKKSGLIANVETIWHYRVRARFGPVKKYIEIQIRVKYKYRNTKIQVQEVEMIANVVLKPSGMAMLAPGEDRGETPWRGIML